MSVTTISPQEFSQRMAAGDAGELLDVRTPVEYREVHVAGARNVPLDRLDPKSVQEGRNGTGDLPLYVICRSGSRAGQACEKFIQAGYHDVINVEGGTMACEAAGLSVVRGKKSMSLERQVRIAAGLLVLTGAVLAHFVHPYWIGLSGFVGAGLTFAGITDTCAMGMLIAKMPWNQVSDNSASCCS